MTDFFSWAQAGPPARLMDLLNTPEGETRFVGGCVRDSLLGLPPILDPKKRSGRTDIDLATTFSPQEVINLLAAANIRTIPTGIDHGTVTTVIDHIPFEITTLRSDVSTDGRRATVSFTKEWSVDAQRRDFTINALYLDQEGNIFDPEQGQADLENAHVRFIGHPHQRIKEDYLRILRFLRFSARFSDQLDEGGWHACAQAQEGLLTLSKERVWQEMSRLFTMPGAPMAIKTAAQSGMLEKLMPLHPNAELFSNAHVLNGAQISSELGVAALWPRATKDEFKAAFKPSNAEINHFLSLWGASAMWEGGEDPRAILYHHGASAAQDGLVLFAASQQNMLSDYNRFAELKTSLHHMSIPVLPVKGGHFIKRGISPGPEVSERLRAFEELWIKKGFPDDQKTVDTLFEEVLQT